MSHQEGEIGPIWTLLLVSPLYLFTLFMLIGGVFGALFMVFMLVSMLFKGAHDKSLTMMLIMGVSTLTNLGIGIPGTILMHRKMRPHVEEIRDDVATKYRMRADRRAQGGSLSLSESVGDEGGLSVVAARDEGAQGVVFSIEDTADVREVHHNEEAR